MKRRFVLGVAVSLIAGATGSLAAGVNLTPGEVAVGLYNVDPYHTQVGFSVLHMGFSFYSGRFSGVSGELDLRPKAAAESTVRISVPVASVSTTSAKLDGELKDHDWLDAKTFPTMTFRSTSVSPSSQGEANVAGELTLHGVTKPVLLKVRFVGSGINPLDKRYTAGFEISGDIKRSDFGVTKFMPLIGDEVHIAINAAFEKQ